MAYKVTIIYAGPTAPEHIQFVSPICRLHVPSPSYTDTPAYANTVYNTNVPGFGKIDLMEPFASTSFPFPVPLAQFKLAVVGEDVKDKSNNPTGEKKATFVVETYMEAFWYTQAGIALADQGFSVTVEEVVS